MPRTVLPGKPYPQGATWDGMGVNFALYSERADAVELCLLGDGGALRLGERPAAAGADERIDHLRAAREGIHSAASRFAGASARDVCGAGYGRLCRLLEEARNYGGGADAGARVSR